MLSYLVLEQVDLELAVRDAWRVRVDWQAQNVVDRA